MIDNPSESLLERSFFPCFVVLIKFTITATAPKWPNRLIQIMNNFWFYIEDLTTNFDYFVDGDFFTAANIYWTEIFFFIHNFIDFSNGVVDIQKSTSLLAVSPDTDFVRLLSNNCLVCNLGWEFGFDPLI